MISWHLNLAWVGAQCLFLLPLSNTSLYCLLKISLRRPTSPQNIPNISSRNKDSDFISKTGGILGLPSLGFVYEYLLPETDV